MNSCCLLAGQPEVRKKQRPPITPRKPKPTAATATAAVEPFSSALSSLSSLSSAVTNVAAGKPCFLLPNAGFTRSRNYYQKLARKNLTQVHHSFLHQNNSPANHVARFVSRAGQFLCGNRAVFYCVQETRVYPGCSTPLKQIYSPWRRITNSPQGEYLF